jgi:mRNA interferase HigB
VRGGSGSQERPCSPFGNMPTLQPLHIIAQSRLKAFWEKPGRTDSEGPLRAWHAEVDGSTWTKTSDIKSRYPSASFLARNRVVFNIKGNTYRLVVDVRYKAKIVFVVWIGTHSEYDNLDISSL